MTTTYTTMWKFEMNFYYCSDFTWNQFSESSENDIFAIFLALHFDNLANLSLHKVQIHKNKNSESFNNVLNWQIVRLDFGWAIFISRRIWVIGISFNFQTVYVCTYIQCLTSSPANFAWNFQIHFSLELLGGFDQTQSLIKA